MLVIPKKYYDFLITESTTWTEQEIISSDQQTEIISLYEAREHSLRKVLLIAGLVLLLLGGISFLAAKWHTIAKWFRVCVILLGYAASIFGYKITINSRASKLLLLISSLIFGSGIYLITRMYDYKLEYHEVLFWWTLQMLITSTVTLDNWQIYFSQAVSLIYMLMINAIDIFALEFMGNAKISPILFFEPIRAWIILLSLWAVCIRLKDRPALNMNMMLTLAVISSRLSLCFGGTWTLIIISIIGTILTFTQYNDAELLGLVILGLSGLMLTWPNVWRGIFTDYKTLLSIMSAIYTSSIMLLNIKRGHSAIGITFCIIILMRYFFDHLLGYIPKAWTFTTLGIILVGLGIYFGPNRRINRED